MPYSNIVQFRHQELWLAFSRWIFLQSISEKHRYKNVIILQMFWCLPADTSALWILCPYKITSRWSSTGCHGYFLTKPFQTYSLGYRTTGNLASSTVWFLAKTESKLSTFSTTRLVLFLSLVSSFAGRTLAYQKPTLSNDLRLTSMKIQKTENIFNSSFSRRPEPHH